MATKNDKPVDGNKKQVEELNEIETLELKDGSEALAPPLNPRDAMMQTVVDNSIDDRNQAYIDEGLEPPGSASASELELPEELKHLEDVDDDIGKDKKTVDNDGSSDNTQIVSREGKQFILIKVDGIDKEIPLDEAVTYLQKNENADVKLGQANNLLNQAKTIQQSSASTPPDDSTDPVVDKSAVKSAFEKLYDGDVEGATDEFAAQLASNQSPQVDIKSQVAIEVARLTDHNDLKSSFERFSSNEDFKPLVNDPTLMSKVDVFTVELQQDQAFMSTNPSYEEIFSEAGRRTHQWLENIAPTKADDKIIESRIDRKRSKPQSVNSRTVRRGPKQESKAPTREDNIAKMAKARGQNIYN